MTWVPKSARVLVVDALGRELSPCPAARAQDLVALGRATIVAEDPPTIRLARQVGPLPARQPATEPSVAAGTPLLLHICCGPCAIYPVHRLRQVGFQVVGWWYNPNIQPRAEYALREESARTYATRASLSWLTAPYEPDRFEDAIRGHEAGGDRCRRCYRLRLEEAAREARRQGIQVITTTLLISPHQDQGALRSIGEEVAMRYGLQFYFENLRRGWSERGRLAREYGLYLQQYCGCRFSLAERRQAALAGPGLPEEDSRK